MSFTASFVNWIWVLVSPCSFSCFWTRCRSAICTFSSCKVWSFQLCEKQWLQVTIHVSIASGYLNPKVVLQGYLFRVIIFFMILENNSSFPYTVAIPLSIIPTHLSIVNLKVDNWAAELVFLWSQRWVGD